MFVVRSTLFRRVGVAKSGSKIEMSQNSPRPLEINSLSVAEYEYDDARVVRNRLTSQKSWFRNSNSSFLSTFRDF